ncbi:polysaccharide pyruvyl transferase family protein [Micromonospora carbonacea]|uniref:Polysaccharide pyruvyl transferase family protein n=1 Tax=Micromonospora carbonacea TaxID=47853 RepID=A0A7H8XHT6_9ACTN|nr:polysaccharide pyruvyl transferase family protein [Micromonospora carbonacea]MBB5828355.1 polysaccharide pyruvyl transferase WcaK-like protein [Micromonospora carbonacea]QLD24028.1 polysaccharide pyruvyl transferase family protein [Micromonospora carbonacea]
MRPEPAPTRPAPAAVARRPLVVGYYGMENVGDNAFCVVMDWATRVYWGAEEPVFAAPPMVDLPPERTGMDPRWYRSRGTADRAGWVLNKAALLRRSTMLVFGGGSVFREMGPLSEKKVFSLFSGVSGHPMAAVGVSVGPFVSAASERRLLRVLRRVAFIGVRDIASAEVLERAGYPGVLVPAGDLAGLLPEALGEPVPPRRPRPTGRARLGVTLLGVDYEAADADVRRREDALVEGVRALVRAEPVDVTVFVFNTHPLHGDERVGERLRAAVAGHCDVRVVTARDGVRACWDEMKRCDLGLHMRLHGAVFAYLAGVPFTLVPYQRKCDDFLDEIGQPAALRTPAVPGDAAAVTRTLTGLLTTEEVPELPRAIYAERARRNFSAAPWARG